MKIALVFGVLCIATLVAARKSQKSDLVEETNEEPDFTVDSHEHNYKKYGKNMEYKHHHHQHQKIQSQDKISHKYAGRKHEEQKKKQKDVPKTAPLEVPSEEAELQADLKTNKKHLKEEYNNYGNEDLHLQDLTVEENSKPKSAKFPHQYQRGHHKTSQHFARHQTPNHEKNTPVEEKLFEDQPRLYKEEKAPVLEDSFEALNENKETKKHSKNHSKQNKKAYQKVKNEKKNKKEKKYKNKDEKKKW